MMKDWGDMTRRNEDVRVLFYESCRVGAVKALYRSGRPATAPNETKQLDIALSFTVLEQYYTSCMFSVGSVHNILK